MPDPTNHTPNSDHALDETALYQPQVGGTTLDEAIAEEEVAWTWVPTEAEQTRIDTVLDYAGPENTGQSPLEALLFAEEVDAENTANALEVTAQGGATGLDLDGLDDAAASAGLSVGDPLVERARAELLAQALDVGDAHLTATGVDESGAADPAAAEGDSGWLVFDPTAGGFVDLPVGHPILTGLAAAVDPARQQAQVGADAVAIDHAWWDERATTHDRAADDTHDRDHTAGPDDGAGDGTDADLGWSR